jgi:hypothetical protein
MAGEQDRAFPQEITRTELERRCNSIEEAYEFMLAYAAQGLAGDGASQSGGQLREFLKGSVAALSGLGDLFGTFVAEAGLAHADRYHAFLTVLDRDAADTLAAIQLVLIQPSISSQLIDNLNASIHVRALLTDLFLIDEILKGQSLAAKLES